MNTKTIAIAIGAALLLFGAMATVGYARDASDGSIDAFDDTKWEETSGDGIREPGDPGYAVPATTVPPVDIRAIEEAFIDGVEPFMDDIRDFGITKLELVAYGYTLCRESNESVASAVKSTFLTPTSNDVFVILEYDRAVERTTLLWQNIRAEALWSGLCDIE